MGKRKYIDQIDIALLNALKFNPNSTVKELAHFVDLSAGPTHTRIARLKQIRVLNNEFRIDYAHLGLKEKICFFELKQSEDSLAVFNPHRIFDRITKRLSAIDDILIETVELFKNEDESHWVIIRFYPKQNNPPREARGDIPKAYDYELYIFERIGKYMRSNMKYLNLCIREKGEPRLTSNHRMKNRPQH